MTILKLFKALAEKESVAHHQQHDIKDSLRKKFVSEIEDAHAEWELACINYQQASQPDVIDYYIYMMKAAQIKYQYLLKTAKISGIVCETKILAERRLPYDYELADETPQVNHS